MPGKLSLAALCLLAGALTGCADDIIIEKNVAMTTRDGVTLRADVYRPKADGKYPVILERTPYDKGIETFGKRAAAQGYVFIVQDVRGRVASDGEWYPLKHEADDGYDSVEWAAALPYANGKVGMFGFSYPGGTQLMAAMANPPHLVCIMPVAIASNCHEQWVYQGGAFSQLLNQAWSTALAFNTIEKRGGKGTPPANWDTKRPLIDYPILEGAAADVAPYYYDWLKHPDYDDYWKRWVIEEHFNQIQVPILHVGGWYDMFEEGAIRSYLGIRNHGGSEAARKGQRLVMMVGGHAGAGPKIGDIDFGKSVVVDLGELALRWYDYQMKGIDNGMAGEKPVRVFLMGRNVWRDLEDWPPANAKVTRYFLHSGGKANALTGDGALSTTPPATEPADQYVYDPADPVPTHGGPSFGGANSTPGPYDQRTVEARPDVLVYSTPAFAQDTEVIGPVALELYVSSSAVDTDFTGKLIDVAPDGYARNLSEGILRARYRTSREQAELMQPGEIYRVTVDLGSTANVFLAGHKLRVEVSSSNFPRFDRNLNTGADIASPDPRAIKATNVIYHDHEHPSALVLSVAP
ncbi:MAG: CocE/NonD family hydrolase [Opitutaceae bacterium]|nr:CocE/NonD family hydrolase [Opitutaceae bacterium]